jgi:iron(III) transport system substrate-binding protein
MMTRRECVRRFGGLAAVLGGCGPGAADAPRVVVYSALDREFSEPILLDFARKTGVRVVPKYDNESTKTIGLVNGILAEAARPVCDVFWNNEVLNTIRLKNAGRLAVVRPANASAFPDHVRDPDSTWFGLAARARVLLVNTDRVAEADRPTRVEDLSNPRWKGDCGIAKPLFGTTATHAACLFAVWGPSRARGFFQSLRANDAQVLSGNRGVAQAVGTGRLAFGLTDTDDALVEIDAGSPVAIVYPDLEPGGLGTLFIPNTLAVIEGSSHRKDAETLLNHLLGPEVERALAEGPSGQIPLNPAVSMRLKVESPRTVRPMSVDFQRAADDWDEAAAFLLTEFGSA